MKGGFACDVAIVGAGPAGAACALALAKAGIEHPLLLDAGSASERPAVGETIPPDARLLLGRLGLWEEFVGEGHEPCLGSCSAWGSDVIGHNDFLLNPHGSGWHLDRARFDAFLRRRACAAGARPVQGRLAGVSSDHDRGHRLTLGDGRTIAARYVVDASGRASALARAMGARQLPLDRLSFVYGFFDAAGAASRSRLTLLEAAPHGWWYAAALPEARLAVAFASDAEYVRAHGMGREPRWLEEAGATRHLSARLEGCLFLAGSLTPRIAASFLLDRVAGPRWLAAGDAAACFDPLAAQGIYKALEDGIDAAASIAKALRADAEIGPSYAEAAGARFAQYLVNRNHFYGLEQRWPGSAFWQRRQARLELAAA